MKNFVQEAYSISALMVMGMVVGAVVVTFPDLNQTFNLFQKIVWIFGAMLSFFWIVGGILYLIANSFKWQQED